MATAVLMPKVGITVSECILTGWLKQVGDKVAAGEPLFAYETDKASMECESTEEGTVLKLLYGTGDVVPVLEPVCVIGVPGETPELPPAGEAGSAPEGDPVPPSESAGPIPESAGSPPAPGVRAGRISPRARKVARAQNVDATVISGTGPDGRVIERDVRRLLAEGGGATAAAFDAGAIPGRHAGTGIGGRVSMADLTANLPGPSVSAPDYEDVVFTGIRRAISKSMTASLRDIPQLTNHFSFDATALMAYRAKLKSCAENLGLPNITYNDMILFAVSRLLKNHPDLNAHMLDANTLRRFQAVHLAMAVDTPRGLLVPVIRNADKLSLSAIATEAKRLAAAAQAGTVSPDEMTGGTFTVSNVGSFGVEIFTPVINPPQTGILGVNNIIQRVREVGGNISAYPAMGLSLTYDHRAVDGAPASRFGKELCDALGNFPLLLAL